MKKLTYIFVLLIALGHLFQAQTVIPEAEDWNWIKYENNPVLTNGPDSSWDGVSAYMPSVLKIDSLYHMWYRGYSLEGKTAIGYASSSDGKNWTKYEGNPVLVPGGAGSWTNEEVLTTPEVYYDGETFHMWYFGVVISTFVGDIGYASSPDGLNWTKYENNPVLTTSMGFYWDNHFVGSPSIIHEDDQYRMWFAGSTTWQCEKFGTATSTAGIDWDKYGPIMGLCEGESILWVPEVVKSPEGNYYMWYTEGPWGNLGFLNRFRLSIRYASSTDGMVWKQYPGHFALEKGESGDWDNLYLGTSSVLYNQEKNLYEMWYGGVSTDEEHYCIGYASAQVPTDTTTDVSPRDKILVEYSLSQNYPNPFNPNTTINYSIPNQNSVTIKVFDLLGSEIATLLNKEQSQGNYEAEFDGSDLTSGIYFYRLQAGNFVETKKMILLK